MSGRRKKQPVTLSFLTVAKAMMVEAVRCMNKDHPGDEPVALPDVFVPTAHAEVMFGQLRVVITAPLVEKEEVGS